MTKEQEDLLEKIKKMPLDQLMSYRSIARNINFITWVGGIGFLLLTLIYPGFFMALCSAIIVGICATMSVNLDRVFEVIQERIQDLDK
jgi:hypothetical protein